MDDFVEEFDSTSCSSSSESSDSAGSGESSCEAGESELNESQEERSIPSNLPFSPKSPSSRHAPTAKRKRLRKRKGVGLRKKLRTHIESVEEFNPEARDAQSAELERIRRLELQQSVCVDTEVGPSGPPPVGTKSDNLMVEEQGGHYPVRESMCSPGLIPKARSIKQSVTGVARVVPVEAIVIDSSSSSDSESSDGELIQTVSRPSVVGGPSRPPVSNVPLLQARQALPSTSAASPKQLRGKYDMIGQCIDGKVLVNVGHAPNERDVFLAPQLSSAAKPHQVGGIRFLYDNIVESLTRFESTPGFGCILAHSMGLGKTMQAIAFTDIFLRYTSAKSVLCIVPVNTLQNWLSEFDHWMPSPEQSASSSSLAGQVSARTFQVFIVSESAKTMEDREKVITDWYKQGGVLLIGYEMYRLLSLSVPSLGGNKMATKRKKSGAQQPVAGTSLQAAIDLDQTEKAMESLMTIQHALCDPGPDLVICDEGHRIKNDYSNISQALKRVKTRRRVVMTGYPLQNNLMEYWCMVDFVRPKYLGTKQEFADLFERPITNGQCVDSNIKDVQLMRHRSHVLHSLLEGFVLRRGHEILRDTLPPKFEHVLLLRPSVSQATLYNYAIDQIRSGSGTTSAGPLKAFAMCSKIWNHPDIYYNEVKAQERRGSPEVRGRGSPAPSIDEMGVVKPGGVRGVASESSTMKLDWPASLTDYVPGQVNESPKMMVLLEILCQSVHLGERVLIFSQSLATLTYVEKLLSQCQIPIPQTGSGLGSAKEIKFSDAKWTRNKNFCRLDGSTNSLERDRLITHFNSASNSDCWVFLLSTKAGCLGINLVGANRVVVLDVSWNPCYDAQAVCRVYRYGQTKSSFIYRLVCDGTMERKMYDRQISKQGMANRVVDELTPERHLTVNDIITLMNPLTKLPDPVNFSANASEFLFDPVLVNLCTTSGHLMTKLPFKHESLLLDSVEERMTDFEKHEALQSFQKDLRSLRGTAQPPMGAGVKRPVAVSGHETQPPGYRGPVQWQSRTTGQEGSGPSSGFKGQQQGQQQQQLVAGHRGPSPGFKGPPIFQRAMGNILKGVAGPQKSSLPAQQTSVPGIKSESRSSPTSPWLHNVLTQQENMATQQRASPVEVICLDSSSDEDDDDVDSDLTPLSQVSLDSEGRSSSLSDLRTQATSAALSHTIPLAASSSLLPPQTRALLQQHLMKGQGARSQSPKGGQDAKSNMELSSSKPMSQNLAHTQLDGMAPYFVLHSDLVRCDNLDMEDTMMLHVPSPIPAEPVSPVLSTGSASPNSGYGSHNSPSSSSSSSSSDSSSSDSVNSSPEHSYNHHRFKLQRRLSTLRPSDTFSLSSPPPQPTTPPTSSLLLSSTPPTAMPLLPAGVSTTEQPVVSSAATPSSSLPLQPLTITTTAGTSVTSCTVTSSINGITLLTPCTSIPLLSPTAARLLYLSTGTSLPSSPPEDVHKFFSVSSHAGCSPLMTTSTAVTQSNTKETKPHPLVATPTENKVGVRGAATETGNAVARNTATGKERVKVSEEEIVPMMCSPLSLLLAKDKQTSGNISSHMTAQPCPREQSAASKVDIPIKKLSEEPTDRSRVVAMVSHQSLFLPSVTTSVFSNPADNSSDPKLLASTGPMKERSSVTGITQTTSILGTAIPTCSSRVSLTTPTCSSHVSLAVPTCSSCIPLATPTCNILTFSSDTLATTTLAFHYTQPCAICTEPVQPPMTTPQLSTGALHKLKSSADAASVPISSTCALSMPSSPPRAASPSLFSVESILAGLFTPLSVPGSPPSTENQSPPAQFSMESILSGLFASSAQDSGHQSPSAKPLYVTSSLTKHTSKGGTDLLLTTARSSGQSVSVSASSGLPLWSHVTNHVTDTNKPAVVSIHKGAVMISWPGSRADSSRASTNTLQTGVSTTSSYQRSTTGTLAGVPTISTSKTHPVPATIGTYPIPATTRTHPVPATTGTHPVPATTGTHPVPATTGTHPVPATTGTHPVPATTGTHPVPASGMHPVPATTGTHPVPASGMHPVPAITGTHPVPTSGMHPVPATTGMHPVSASGMHPVPATTGMHPVSATTGTHPVPATNGTHPVPASGMHPVSTTNGTHPVPASGMFLLSAANGIIHPVPADGVSASNGIHPVPSGGMPALVPATNGTHPVPVSRMHPVPTSKMHPTPTRTHPVPASRTHTVNGTHPIPDSEMHPASGTYPTTPVKNGGSPSKHSISATPSLWNKQNSTSPTPKLPIPKLPIHRSSPASKSPLPRTPTATNSPNLRMLSPKSPRLENGGFFCFPVPGKDVPAHSAVNVSVSASLSSPTKTRDVGGGYTRNILTQLSMSTPPNVVCPSSLKSQRSSDESIPKSVTIRRNGTGSLDLKHLSSQTVHRHNVGEKQQNLQVGIGRSISPTRVGSFQQSISSRASPLQQSISPTREESVSNVHSVTNVSSSSECSVKPQSTTTAVNGNKKLRAPIATVPMATWKGSGSSMSPSSPSSIARCDSVGKIVPSPHDIHSMNLFRIPPITVTTSVDYASRQTNSSPFQQQQYSSELKPLHSVSMLQKTSSQTAPSVLGNRPCSPMVSSSLQVPVASSMMSSRPPSLVPVTSSRSPSLQVPVASSVMSSRPPSLQVPIALSTSAKGPQLSLASNHMIPGQHTQLFHQSNSHHSHLTKGNTSSGLSVTGASVTYSQQLNTGQDQLVSPISPYPPVVGSSVFSSSANGTPLSGSSANRTPAKCLLLSGSSASRTSANCLPLSGSSASRTPANCLPLSGSSASRTPANCLPLSGSSPHPPALINDLPPTVSEQLQQVLLTAQEFIMKEQVRQLEGQQQPEGDSNCTQHHNVVGVTPTTSALPTTTGWHLPADCHGTAQPDTTSSLQLPNQLHRLSATASSLLLSDQPRELSSTTSSPDQPRGLSTTPTATSPLLLPDQPCGLSATPTATSSMLLRDQPHGVSATPTATSSMLLPDQPRELSATPTATSSMLLPDQPLGHSTPKTSPHDQISPPRKMAVVAPYRRGCQHKSALQSSSLLKSREPNRIAPQNVASNPATVTSRESKAPSAQLSDNANTRKETTFNNPLPPCTNPSLRGILAHRTPNSGQFTAVCSSAGKRGGIECPPNVTSPQHLPPPNMTSPQPPNVTSPQHLFPPNETSPQHLLPPPNVTSQHLLPPPPNVTSPQHLHPPNMTSPQHLPPPNVTSPQHLPPPNVTSPHHLRPPNVTSPQHLPPPNVTSPQHLPPPNVTSLQYLPPPNVTSPPYHHHNTNQPNNPQIITSTNPRSDLSLVSQSQQGSSGSPLTSAAAAIKKTSSRGLPTIKSPLPVMHMTTSQQASHQEQSSLRTTTQNHQSLNHRHQSLSSSNTLSAGDQPSLATGMLHYHLNKQQQQSANVAAHRNSSHQSTHTHLLHPTNTMPQSPPVTATRPGINTTDSNTASLHFTGNRHLPSSVANGHVSPDRGCNGTGGDIVSFHSLSGPDCGHSGTGSGSGGFHSLSAAGAAGVEQHVTVEAGLVTNVVIGGGGGGGGGINQTEVARVARREVGSYH